MKFGHFFLFQEIEVTPLLTPRFLSECEVYSSKYSHENSCNRRFGAVAGVN